MARRAEGGMSPSRPAYQPDHASAGIGGAALLGLISLAALAIALVFAMFVIFRAHDVHAPATALEQVRLVPPGPRLEANPRQERVALDAAAQKRIETYGWTDAGKTLARIPIERAMALQAAKGWPDTAGTKP
jgi:hypothetical protein